MVVSFVALQQECSLVELRFGKGLSVFTQASSHESKDMQVGVHPTSLGSGSPHDPQKDKWYGWLMDWRLLSCVSSGYFTISQKPSVYQFC